MVTKERLQIILDLSPFPPQQLIRHIVIAERMVIIDALEIDEKGNVNESRWSMPIKSNESDEYTLE
jgi:hypothetical protein